MWRRPGLALAVAALAAGAPVSSASAYRQGLIFLPFNVAEAAVAGAAAVVAAPFELLVGPPVPPVPPVPAAPYPAASYAPAPYAPAPYAPAPSYMAAPYPYGYPGAGYGYPAD